MRREFPMLRKALALAGAYGVLALEPDPEDRWRVVDAALAEPGRPLERALALYRGRPLAVPGEPLQVLPGSRLDRLFREGVPAVATVGDALRDLGRLDLPPEAGFLLGDVVVVGLPIRVQGEQVGALLWFLPGRLYPERLALLEAVAEWAGLWVENARLRTERDALHRLREAISSLGDLLAGEASYRAVLRPVLEVLGGALGAYQVGLLVWERGAEAPSLEVRVPPEAQGPLSDLLKAMAQGEGSAVHRLEKGPGSPALLYGVPLQGQVRPILGILYALVDPENPLGRAEQTTLEEAALLLASLLEVEEMALDLAQAEADALRMLALLAEAHDPDTGRHLQRCFALTRALARKMGLPPAAAYEVALASLTHDVGKVALPREILTKPGPLTPEEWDLMRQHPLRGWELLSTSPRHHLAALVARHHHERWDGGGYPDGLKGEEIPLAARIMAVADAVDAIVSGRPYRPARPLQEAVEAVTREAGRQFDPGVVQALTALWEEGTLERLLAEAS